MYQAPSSVGIVIPIRSFRNAFTRLNAVVPEPQRFQLARDLADRVREACQDLPVLVVSSDEEVRSWARTHDLTSTLDPGSLSAAAEAGRRYWAAQAMTRVAIVHADLPRIRSLHPVLRAPTPVVVVPCHRNDGTPVLVVPAEEPLTFAYGPGSFAAHIEAAATAGFDTTVVLDDDLRIDIDTAEDYDAFVTTTSLPCC